MSSSLKYKRKLEPLNDFECGPLHYENFELEDIHKRLHSADGVLTEKNKEEEEFAFAYIKDLEEVTNMDPSLNTWEKATMKVLKTKKKPIPRKMLLLKYFRKLNSPNKKIYEMLITKRSKSDSGVLVITVLTAPTFTDEENKIQAFSCKNDCFYCPNQPGQPRSYLRDEPAVLRANQNGFDPILQFCDRATALYEMGQEIDKIELLILGGTYSAYPLQYREDFLCDLFYAANTFFDSLPLRKRMTLSEEQDVNSKLNHCRIIGITVETRPDSINASELIHFRKIGCTRVQLGIQHTSDYVLKKVNRGCTKQDAMEAIFLLKECCFKVDAHYMPNLPYSTPEMDLQMLREACEDPDLLVDQMKIYPCEIVPFTKIEKWFKEGTYVPYTEAELMEVLITFKTQIIKPFIRLNRIIRDIPTTYSKESGAPILDTKYRDTVKKEMKRRKLRDCVCIRCREVGERDYQPGKAKLEVIEYEASRQGVEYFISFEEGGGDENKILYGFCRLRIPSKRACVNHTIFPELKGCALVRELHVYGSIYSGVQAETKETAKVIWNAPAQHQGLGARLLLEAEIIARRNGFSKMAVIAGVGTRLYYMKQGYKEEGLYLTKELVVITGKSSHLGRNLLLAVTMATLFVKYLLVQI